MRSLREGCARGSGGASSPEPPPAQAHPNPCDPVMASSAAPRAPGPGALLRIPAGWFDRLHHAWEGPRAQRRLGTTLVVVFLGAIGVIELNRLGLLPPGLWPGLTTNHLKAVYVAFTLLLFIEIVGLVFALARSVAESVGKQFELLALILLRKAFLEFAQFGEPIRWEDVEPVLPVIVADVGGALAIFVVLGFYYRVQRHRPITMDPGERASFVAAKKVVALLLLAAFAGLVAADAARMAREGDTDRFFEAFYTILIFSDILLVLISLRYSASFAVVFRNSGFAAATVLIRLALTAPAYVNAVLGLAAALFALGLSLAYNHVVQELAVAPRRDGLILRDERAPDD